MIDYFNLCAEEYLWVKKGRIPKDVWKAWKAGIETNLKIPQIRALFIEQNNNDSKVDSYYGLRKELEI